MGLRGIDPERLPPNFWKRNVEDRRWKLSGAEDLAISGRQVKMERLREIVAGLENGNIKFVEEGMRIDTNS